VLGDFYGVGMCKHFFKSCLKELFFDVPKILYLNGLKACCFNAMKFKIELSNYKIYYFQSINILDK
jgi:hypothetical protein